MAAADFPQRPAIMILKPLLMALQFLTRIPVPPLHDITPRDSGRSMLFYPLVGALIGFMLFAVEHLLHDSAPLLRAVILVALWVAITGALHLDGLADMVDGWIGGHGDRERTLAIMKDPYCGPMGVAALLLVLLLKVAALEQVAGHDSWLLIIVPLLGRTLLLLLFLTTPYVRAGGLGETLSKELPRTAGWIIVALLLLGILLVAGIAWGMLLATLTVFALFRSALMVRLGGTTGDTAGALLELCEMTVLLYAALL
jgi:adenosylcobinamide-GDP ribazoletransferase